MTTYLYLSMIPESLVASMLPPKEFGVYLATGTQKRSSGQAMFFDLKENFQSEYFDLSGLAQRCVPHPDGQPKHSVYVSIYRVLEHVPLDAIGNLWLVTRDGRVLELEQGDVPEELPGRFHLYQETCPVHPLIASSLEPRQFCCHITDSTKPISVPRICFVEMELGELANNPRSGDASDLPYPHMDHVRGCLVELAEGPDKHVKTVDRIQPQSFPYRCIRSGFFLGGQEGILYYPFPADDQLEDKYRTWWRSANV